MTVNVLARRMGRHARPLSIEVCASRGPRIGSEGMPFCAGPRGVKHYHRGFPGSGWEHEHWDDFGGAMLMRDAEFAAEWSRARLPLDFSGLRP